MSADLHVTLTIIRDSGEQDSEPLYLRDRLTFSGPEQARRYQGRLLAWLAARPAPGELGELQPLAAPGWRPEQLDGILDRMDEWAPLPTSKVYDWNARG